MVYAVRRRDNVCAQQGLRSHAAAHSEVPLSLLVARFHGLAFRRLRRALCRHRAAIRSYPEVLGVTGAGDSGVAWQLRSARCAFAKAKAFLSSPLIRSELSKACENGDTNKKAAPAAWFRAGSSPLPFAGGSGWAP